MNLFDNDDFLRMVPDGYMYIEFDTASDIDIKYLHRKLKDGIEVIGKNLIRYNWYVYDISQLYNCMIIRSMHVRRIYLSKDFKRIDEIGIFKCQYNLIYISAPGVNFISQNAFFNTPNLHSFSTEAESLEMYDNSFSSSGVNTMYIPFSTKIYNTRFGDDSWLKNCNFIFHNFPERSGNAIEYLCKYAKGVGVMVDDKGVII